MADPITAEQVARAIEAARSDEGGISDALGGWQWDKRAPDYVRVAWGKPSLPDFIAALTRWRDELVAAETPRKVARWDPKSSSYILMPPYADTHNHVPRVSHAETATKLGYEIEGGPEPVQSLSRCPDCGGPRTDADEHDAWCDDCWGKRCQPAEDSPERLRERREALGKDDAWIEHILSALDVGVGPDFGYGRERRIAAEGVSSYTEKSTVTMRAAYAAALSAAEVERAAKPDHLAYADSPVWDDGPLPTPTPERPAPRFKVGDWVRHRESAGAWQVASFFEDSRGYVYCWNSHHSGFPEDVIVAAEVPGEPVPASPPAPEVVDVPQPIVKRCACPDVHDDVEAEWRTGEPYLTVTHTTVPLALLRAMLEAIDSQQGGAS